MGTDSLVTRHLRTLEFKKGAFVEELYQGGPGPGGMLRWGMLATKPSQNTSVELVVGSERHWLISTPAWG